MKGPVFGYAEFQRLIEGFAATIPDLFQKHPLTADLMPRVSALLDMAESPFTVAIVGQMRVGKSSLLNSLVGRDLAVTGVTETTATINWFHYGTAAQRDRFRVCWKDRPAEEFDRAEIDRWVGDSDTATATRCIEFFDDAEFLKVASIVDTPGTRSTIAAHEAATSDFIGLRHEVDTRQLGSKADAIIYVVMPVARETDDTFLAAFREATRLPGSSAYNSIAVLHKWETLEAERPLEEAANKANRIRNALSESVSEVLPVSAPLAMAADRFDDKFWSLACRLGRDSSPQALDSVVLSDQRFTGREVSGCALNRSERQMLRDGYRLPWPSLKVIIRLVQRIGGDDPVALRTAIREASGIDRLHAELDRRFFARTRVIKTFSLLAKALEPCQIAQSRLRNQKLTLSDSLQRLGELGRMLESRIATGDSELSAVSDYMQATRSAVEREVDQVSALLTQLSSVVLPVHDAYQDMEADLAALETLDSANERLGSETAQELRTLFGYRGPDIASRLAGINGADGSPLDLIEVAIAKYRRLAFGFTGDLRRLCEHAVARLEQIADTIETRES